MDATRGPPERLLQTQAALGLRAGAEVAAVSGEQVERHEGGRRLGGELLHPPRRRVQSQLQGVEVEPTLGGDHDLAVDHAPSWKAGAKARFQLRKVPGSAVVFRAPWAARRIPRRRHFGRSTLVIEGTRDAVAGVVGLETSGTTRRKRQHKATAEDLDLSGPVELIVLAVKEPAARFKLLGSDRAITSAFRPSRPPRFPPEHLLWHATSSLTPGLTGRSGTAPPPCRGVRGSRPVERSRGLPVHPLRTFFLTPHLSASYVGLRRGATDRRCRAQGGGVSVG